MTYPTTIYILHGCPSAEKDEMNPPTSTYDKHWIPWVSAELLKRGYEVKTPHMPSPWTPDYNAFKKEFENNQINENDILIGHSCGGAFLVRWLGDTKQKIAKLILVAPWKIPDEGDELRQEYYGYEIDRTIAKRVGEITIFTSNDEEEDGKVSVKIFHGALGGNLIELPEHGHYTLGDMGTDAFPELIEAIIKEN